MARISGIDIPREKRVIASLRYIHGVGAKRAEDICNDLEINPDTRVNNLTNDEVAKIRKYIESNFRVEGDLRRDVSQNIRRKTEIGTYQGMRHRTGLPVRGQRTHTNARTRKGPRFAIAGKKKVMKKWQSKNQRKKIKKIFLLELHILKQASTIQLSIYLTLMEKQ